ncbi:bifunctional folylpolyglutamate synthase/dihydrofolate synthase [Helicobacter rodentium]|uniref:bifunctional folylpolyglutamate synthase/dihydrofolate synthase n=2 Tax=Helicobacter rodentium TaxID=59617 RepID=UPI0023F18CEE|nr:Mur ligase family protein [Helicobacter rodentium]
MNLNMHNETQLERFLDEKGQEYAPFDPLRAPRILKQLKIPHSATQRVIQIIGTNGKGSTGRFLSLMLYKLGVNVGHFSSPHLLCLGERFWKNGANLSRETLNEAFLALDSVAESGLEQASYFEVLTFLALSVFSDCEVLVLEAGLGGEFDSTTTCVKADLSLFTSIGLDHQEFLGDTLEKIATTKLNAMSKRAILGFQSEVNEDKNIVKEIAKRIAKEKNAQLKILDGIPTQIEQFVKTKDYPTYQAKNLTLAYNGLLALREILEQKPKEIALDSLLESLPPLDLQGRMQKLAPNLYLDVAHNVNAAQALVEHFKKNGFSQNKCVLIYNSFFDKRPSAVLSALKPIIQRVEILKVINERIIEKTKLEQILQDLEIEFKDFEGINPQENYLVCGSFSVVARFLKCFSENKIRLIGGEA